MRDSGRWVPRSFTRIASDHEQLDFRTQLSATDYGNFLANEPLPISTSTIADKATQILVDQFNYLRSNAVEPLSKFLDYITSVLCLFHLIHVLTAEIQLRVYDWQCGSSDHRNAARERHPRITGTMSSVRRVWHDACPVCCYERWWVVSRRACRNPTRWTLLPLIPYSSYSQST